MTVWPHWHQFSMEEHYRYIWFKYDLEQKYYAPQVRPNRGSNSWPPDHDSTFHVTETPALTTWPSVTSKYIVPFFYLSLFCYSHPGVDGIMLWGFWDEEIWKPDSSLVDGEHLVVSARSSIHISILNFDRQLPQDPRSFRYLFHELYLGPSCVVGLISCTHHIIPYSNSDLITPHILCSHDSQVYSHTQINSWSNPAFALQTWISKT